MALIFAAFGLIAGSFLNVLILRHGAGVFSGRSHCMSCGKQLSAIDLVPLFSWIALRGKCRMCNAAISIQYPLVEAGTALVFLAIGMAPLPLVSRLLALPIACLLIAIAVYDFYHTVIPDAWAYVFAALALAISLSFTADSYIEVIISGPLVAAPLFFLWLMSRGKWMGLGDAKLMLGVGWLLGFADGFISLFFAFVLGAVVSLPLLFFSSRMWSNIRSRFTPTASSRTIPRRFTMKSEIPFGPFLIASCFLVWFMQMYGMTTAFPI